MDENLVKTYITGNKTSQLYFARGFTHMKVVFQSIIFVFVGNSRYLFSL